MQTENMGVGSAFRTTHWTMVLESSRTGAEFSQEAFASLYLAYRRPLYVYVRRRGFSPEEAEDITQDFFAHILEKESLAGLKREGGRFRSFLLGAMQNFLADHWDRARAQKRGGGRKLLSLDADDGEAWLQALTFTEEFSLEMAFERHWAMALLEEVGERLRAEETKAGKSNLFDDLRSHLQSDQAGLPYAEIATRHGMSEGAIKVAVHRLRRRYGQHLREEVARTVSSQAEVDEELRHLISMMRQ
jgi:RNA polymerase sigma-70 factor (ECF subfamily)